MESCCLLIASLLPQSQEELPLSEKRPVRMIVEKLVHFRLDFLLDKDSKTFDPGLWLATIMKTEFELDLKDMNKLSKAISEFLKNLPKGTLGTSELISNDYADYGLQEYTCLLLCIDYGMRTDIPGTVLPEWLPPFRKDLKQAIDAKKKEAEIAATDQGETDGQDNKNSVEDTTGDKHDKGDTDGQDNKNSVEDTTGDKHDKGDTDGQENEETVEDKDDEESKDDKDDTTKSGQLQAAQVGNEGLQHAAEDANAVNPGQQHAAPSMSPGTMVLGKSTKWKDKYDGVKCRVVDLLSKHVKVEIMEGPGKGEFHKYGYDKVAPLAPAGAASVSTSAASASAGAASVSTSAASASAGEAASASAGEAASAPAGVSLPLAPLPPPLAPPEGEVSPSDDSIIDVSKLWENF